MKFMKLGTRPDTFYTTEAIRSVSSEVSTDIKIKVHNTSYLLHKFPLLSKCARLRTLCSECKDSPDGRVIELADIPGGAEAFEICTKFCYGITITLSALNFVPVRCAAGYLQMTDDLDKGNLIGKLEVFFKSCILRRWKDSLLTLQGTAQYPAICEELGITSRCIDAIASMIVAHPSMDDWSRYNKGWWAEDMSELWIDHFWRLMLAVKSAGTLSGTIIGEALQVYASRWLPNMSREANHEMPKYGSSESLREITNKHRLLLEKLVSLLPSEKGAVPCSFLFRLLKAANVLNASAASKMELARRAGVQLEEATVSDLLIPSLSYVDETLYDVEVVMTILEEFMLQGQSPPTSPPRGKFGIERRRSRSAENIEFEAGHENSRRSSSASHSSKLRVAKLIDCYLQEISRDVNLPMEKVIAIAEAVPDFARHDHDDLYKVIDIYLRAHPDLDKNARKKLCRILNCRKLSVEACMHAAQNERLPLRVVVQVLFFEQARAAISGGQVHELPNNIKALLASTAELDDDKEAARHRHTGTATTLEDDWSISGLKYPASRLETLKMKLEEVDNDINDDFIRRNGLLRSSSSRFKALCSIPNKPKKVFSKLWSMNRSVRERH